MPVIIYKILIGFWLLLSGLSFSISVNSWIDNNNTEQKQIENEINLILNDLKKEIQKDITHKIKQNINNYKFKIPKDELESMINNVFDDYFNSTNLNISNITLDYIKKELNYTLPCKDNLIISLYFENIIKKHLKLPPTVKEIHSSNNLNWKEGFIGEYEYEIKIYKHPSEYGIDNSRISKLFIRKKGKTIVNYDRGWDIEPNNQKHKEILNKILDYYK